MCVPSQLNTLEKVTIGNWQVNGIEICSLKLYYFIFKIFLLKLRYIIIKRLNWMSAEVLGRPYSIRLYEYMKQMRQADDTASFCLFWLYYELWVTLQKLFDSVWYWAGVRLI